VVDSDAESGSGDDEYHPLVTVHVAILVRGSSRLRSRTGDESRSPTAVVGALAGLEQRVFEAREGLG
jgi:hypothetical protein